MKKKNAAVFPAMLLMTGSFCTALAADSPPVDVQPPAATAQPFNVEVFQGVRIRNGPGSNAYPVNEVHDGREGWVVLNMMIDPKGKPYEVMVEESSGNPAFDKAALRAVNQVSFEPARRGGTPIDSSFKFKLKFSILDLAKGATPDFVISYRRFVKAIEAGDRQKADSELARLQPKNLYEDAFANFGKFHYDRRWGTPADQLRDLQRAIAGEKKPEYLPKDVFTTALYAMFRLELQFRDYGGALDTWDLLEPFASSEMRKDMKGAVDRLHALQAGDQPIRQSATIGSDNDWRGTLFRKTFSLDVKQGTVNEIKLRCAQQYLFFKYEPGVKYSVGSKKDQCGIEVVGLPGTQFELVH